MLIVKTTQASHRIIQGPERIKTIPSRDRMDSLSAAASTPPSVSANAENSKTLSRNALYTPLRAYEQTLVDPIAYMTNLKNMPASLKESSLSSFMQRVGEDYHRNRATGPDPKNNGSRPLTVSDMHDRLRQRAVTLVGGGVNSAITTSKAKSTETRTRKRPRQEMKQVELARSASHQTDSDMFSFLFSLNKRWNSYILQVLDIKLNNSPYLNHPKEVNGEAIKSKLVAARDCIELAGAHVRIDSCKQKRHLVDNYGLLVGETKNTWSVALRSRPGRTKRTRKVDSQDGKANHVGTTNSGIMNPIEILMIPKEGSSLDVIIPLSLSSNLGDGSNMRDSKQDPSTPMFPLAPRCIFVRLGH